MSLPDILIPNGQTLIHGPSMAHQSAIMRDLIGSASIVHGSTVIICGEAVDDGTDALRALNAWQQHHKGGPHNALSYSVSGCHLLKVGEIVSRVEANIADANNPRAPVFCLWDASRSTRPMSVGDKWRGGAGKL